MLVYLAAYGVLYLAIISSRNFHPPLLTLIPPLVMSRGNPRVSQGIPVPVPAKNPTPDEGYGFSRVGVGVFLINSILFITFQPFSAALQNFACVFRSYDKSYLRKKLKKLSKNSHLWTIFNKSHLKYYNFSTVQCSSSKLCRRIS